MPPQDPMTDAALGTGLMSGYQPGAFAPMGATYQDYISNMYGANPLAANYASNFAPYAQLQYLASGQIPENIGLQAHYENLKKIEATLKDMEPSTMRRKLDLDKWFDKLDEIDRARVSEKGITDAEQAFILKGLGVKDGNIWKSTQKQLDAYAEIVHATRDFEVKNSNYLD